MNLATEAISTLKRVRLPEAHDPGAIQNPNSSGQGHHPDHADHHHHDTLPSMATRTAIRRR